MTKATRGRRAQRASGLAALAVLFLAVLGGAVACVDSRESKGAHLVAGVTPVAGPSWLQRLGLSLEETKMGQMGGNGSPPDSARGQPSAESGRGFTVTGEDLYRLDCRSCHGPDGRGAPPEINSLIPPVEGTSRALVEQRMKNRGRVLGRDFVETLTRQADQSLRDRLAHGGKKMPSFPHLEPNEVDILLVDLKRLAKVPDAPGAGGSRVEPAALVGEHLVKGTCHICHRATGGSTMMMMSREIPSLASLPRELSASVVAAKVIAGRAPMGMMRMMMRARMPVFSYLTEQEVVAAYLYLEAYPPQ